MSVGWLHRGIVGSMLIKAGHVSCTIMRCRSRVAEPSSSMCDRDDGSVHFAKGAAGGCITEYAAAQVPRLQPPPLTLLLTQKPKHHGERQRLQQGLRGHSQGTAVCSEACDWVLPGGLQVCAKLLTPASMRTIRMACHIEGSMLMQSGSPWLYARPRPSPTKALPWFPEADRCGCQRTLGPGG
jgi:hypothetical protein